MNFSQRLSASWDSGRMHRNSSGAPYEGLTNNKQYKKHQSPTGERAKIKNFTLIKIHTFKTK
jgi:hypothetical protein